MKSSTFVRGSGAPPPEKFGIFSSLKCDLALGVLIQGAPHPYILLRVLIGSCDYYQAAAKETAGQATQLIAAARMAGPSNRNQTSQQQLSDQCNVSLKLINIEKF